MKKSKLSGFLFSALGLITFLLVWQLLVMFTKVGLLLPSPVAVGIRFAACCSGLIGKHTLLVHIGYSLLRVMVGYAIAGVLGIIIGLLMAQSETAKAIISPLFAMIRPIPGITWMPLLILWFGTGWLTQEIIIFVAGFSHMVLNTFSGATRTDPKLIGAAKMLGANDRQIFLKVILPSSVPYIFSGLQVSLSSCWMAVLAAEMMTAQEGVGWMIVSGQNAGDIEQILVGIVIISVIGMILAGVMRGVEGKLCAWTIRGK